MKTTTKNHLKATFLLSLLILSTQSAFATTAVIEQVDNTAENETTDFVFPKVNELWMRAAPPNARMLAAYVAVENNTAQDLKLIGAYAPDFRVAEIHKTTEVDGMLKMRQEKELKLPMQSSVVMQPGGLHIMLMMPKKKFSVGDEVRICLIYQDQSGNEQVQHLDFPVLKK